MDELDKKIEQKAREILEQEKAEKERAEQEKAEQEKLTAMVESMVESAKDPANAVRFEVTNQVSNELRENKEVAERVKETAGKNIHSALKAVENEAQTAVNKSETAELQSYFEQHKEELKTAGIEKHTYKRDMERAVRWHKKCADFHWYTCGWWMTLIRTFFLKAKPFKWFLNSIGILLNIALFGGVVLAILQIIKII